jgi:hypothetical protein
MPDDGGIQGQKSNPEGSGTPAGEGGTPGSGTPSAEQAIAAAEKLGFAVVPEAEMAELKRNYGSVKHGKIASILAKHDELVAADATRKAAGQTDLEKAQMSATALTSENKTLKNDVGRQALRIGILEENLTRTLPDSKKDAVFPEFLNMQVETLLDEFQGGDADAFVSSAVDRMVEGQAKILGRFIPKGATPGGGPVAGHADHGEPLESDDRSEIAKGYDWRSRAVFIHNPVQADGKIRK